MFIYLKLIKLISPTNKIIKKKQLKQKYQIRKDEERLTCENERDKDRDKVEKRMKFLYY